MKANVVTDVATLPVFISPMSETFDVEKVCYETGIRLNRNNGSSFPSQGAIFLPKDRLCVEDMKTVSVPRHARKESLVIGKVILCVVTKRRGGGSPGQVIAVFSRMAFVVFRIKH